MLFALGLPELVAEDSTGYVEVARRLGTNPNWRRSVVDAVTTRMAAKPAFTDTAAYARRLEGALVELCNAADHAGLQEDVLRF